MRSTLHNEHGTALVAALFFITALSLTATVIVWVTGSERRVSHNEYSHVRSFYASDAGSETAINWIRLQQVPPAVVEIDPQTSDQYVKRDNSYTYLYSDHSYKVEVKHRLDASGNLRLRPRPGWDNSWVDFEYVVDSFGSSVTEANTRIEVQAARLYRLDYSY